MLLLFQSLIGQLRCTGSLYVCACIINYYSKSYTNTMQNSSSYNLPTAILTKSPNSFIHLAKKIKIKNPKFIVSLATNFDGTL